MSRAVLISLQPPHSVLLPDFQLLAPASLCHVKKEAVGSEWSHLC